MTVIGKREKRTSTKRGEGGRYAKGTAPGPGRPKGRGDQAVLDFLARGKVMLSTDEYWANAYARILAGEAAHREVYLLNRIFGRPKETVALEGGGLGFQTVLMGPSRDPLADPKAQPALSGGQNEE